MLIFPFSGCRPNGCLDVSRGKMNPEATGWTKRSQSYGSNVCVVWALNGPRSSRGNIHAKLQEGPGESRRQDIGIFVFIFTFPLGDYWWNGLGSLYCAAETWYLWSMSTSSRQHIWLDWLNECVLFLLAQMVNSPWKEWMSARSFIQLSTLKLELVHEKYIYVSIYLSSMFVCMYFEYIYITIPASVMILEKQLCFQFTTKNWRHLLLDVCMIYLDVGSRIILAF